MIRQIMLVLAIPHTITKWSKRSGKDWERKVQSTRFAHLWPLPSQGYWVSLGIGRSVQTPDKASFLGAVFSHYEACKTTEQGSSLVSCRACHSFTQAHWRVSKAENVYTDKAKRLQLWVCLPFPEDPGRSPKMLAYSDRYQIHDLQRRRFSFGTRDQAWSLKSFCVAEFY